MIDIADLKMDFMVLFALPALSLFLFVTYLMVIGILRKILSKDLQSSDEEKVSTLVILGSGGHTTEMLRLVSALSDEKYTPKKFMLAETDSSSIHKLKDNNYDQNIIFIPRSREVRQSWITTIFSTIKATIYCCRILHEYRPTLLLCNGPGTCVPPCLVAWLYNKTTTHKTTIVFVESICRIKSFSLTGKILQYFADSCLVQWPELATKNERFKYIDRFT